MDFSFLITWLLAITAVANAVLGVIAFRKAPRAFLNRLFLGLALNVSLWALAVMVITIKSDYNGLLLWVRISQAIAALIPWFVYALVYAFQGNKDYHNRKILSLLFVSMVLAAASFTPAMIAGLQFPLEKKELVYGPFFPLYALYFSAVAIFTVYALYRQLRLSRGLVRYQLRYFFGGMLISFIMGSLANLFLPLLKITTPDLRHFGPVFTFIMVISITYAIVKYRLMDIRIAVRKVAAYFLAIALLVGVYSLLMVVMENFHIYLEHNILPFTIILVILVAILFQPLKDQMQSLVDRLLYRGAYDYYNILTDASRAMVSILQMDVLLDSLMDKVVNTIYIEQGTFFMKNRDGSFTVAAEKTMEPFSSAGEVELKPWNPLLVYLRQKRDVLLLSDLDAQENDEHRKTLVAEMKKLRAEAIVPIVMESQLEAVVSLGSKISGEPYSREDVSLLSTLSYQVAVALKNARLYQEVLEIKRYLENILKNMGDGLIAIDSRGTITTFNSMAEKLTGIPAGEALGRKAVEVLAPGLCLPIMLTLDEGQLVSNEEVEVQAGSRTCCLCCSTAPIESLEAGERGAIMVLSDVTRIKELESEKNQALRLASLGELAAGMAHEIKNPLVSIKTFAELLPYKYDDSEFRNNFSQIVKQEIERINKLIMELLNFSRIPKPSLEEVEITVVMDEILTLLAPQLDSQKIRLRKRYYEKLPLLEADRDQLKQALLNICLNGIQAMPDGGELGVEIMHAEKPGGGSVKILIKDTGPGIPPHQKERIFDPFFTTKAQGTGMGLSISHRIITDHRGSIKCKSRRKGTVFEISLPAAKEEASADILPDVASHTSPYLRRERSM